MTGQIALHGGGEFLRGDEPCLRAMLSAASSTRPVPSDPIRVVVVPTAASRGRPDIAAANGVAAMTRTASLMGLAIRADPVMVVDAASAHDPASVSALESADLIHLPGGDPGLIPKVLGGSPAWAAIRMAWERGALLAGASAGAMALAEVTWTPDGIIPGLGLVPGVLVIPHADAASWPDRVARIRIAGGAGGAGVAGVSGRGAQGLLGLAERTALVGSPGARWRVIGQGSVRWLPSGAPDAQATVILEADESIVLPSGQQVRDED